MPAADGPGEGGLESIKGALEHLHPEKEALEGAFLHEMREMGELGCPQKGKDG